jgi:hypothetical protein
MRCERANMRRSRWPATVLKPVSQPAVRETVAAASFSFDFTGNLSEIPRFRSPANLSRVAAEGGPAIISG